MNAPAVPPQGEQATGPITLGSGWAWPAAFVAILIALLYVPGHNPLAGGSDDLVTTIGALYAIALSVIAVRLVRGVVLRAGGSREPIALLGGGSDPLVSVGIRPRARVAAIAAGMAVSVVAALLAGRLASVADPAGSAHAIASLALGANAVISVRALLPIPGFPGWALLLALVDGAGTSLDRRVHRAAHVAQSIGVPVALAAGIAAGLLGDPMTMFLGSGLAFLIWTGSQARAAQDATERFLRAHLAGEVARPLVTSAGADEPVVDLVVRLSTDHAVATVEGGGGVLGAIGPRQMAAHEAAAHDKRCSDAMVPLASLRLLGSSSPAVELLPEIARHGFALTRSRDGLGYVEASDLGRQIRIWVALGDRLASTPAPGDANTAQS